MKSRVAIIIQDTKDSVSLKSSLTSDSLCGLPADHILSAMVTVS